MPDASQFTLSLFDTSALGWTVQCPPPEPVVDPEPDHEDERQQLLGVDHPRGTNLHLVGNRDLARGWAARARDNVVAIRLSKALEASCRPATPDEQHQLLRFVGFGASDLAQNCFPLPGETGFRHGWEEIGRELAEITAPEEYAALQRATQYAHYTPEPIIQALWRAAQRLGFTGGRVLEPGMGTGLFFALLPEPLRGACRLAGIEYDPVTARIARLVHPEARVRCEDYTRSRLAGGFDLAVGNPPFADRVVRSDPATAALGLRLHDYFIARSIARLRPGGLALFVTSAGTMDKASRVAREHIASMADLVGAVRLPEASMRATAGTDVVIDVLVFQRRAEIDAAGGQPWIGLSEIEVQAPSGSGDEQELGSEAVPDVPASPGDLRTPQTAAINEYFAAHPEMVLGTHAVRRGIYGPGLTYTCRARTGDRPLATMLDEALGRLPAGIFVPSPESSLVVEEPEDEPVRAGTAADGATIKEGSYPHRQGRPAHADRRR